MLMVLRHFKHGNSDYIMPEIKFIGKGNTCMKRNYLFRMNVTEEIFDIRNRIEILLKIYTIYQYLFYI